MREPQPSSAGPELETTSTQVTREQPTSVPQLPECETQLLINGAFVAAREGGEIEVESPRDGRTLTRVAEGRAADVDRAVEAAEGAAAAWRATSAADRGRLLRRLAERVADSADDLAQLEALDAGHPIRDVVELDIPRAVEVLEYFAGAADKLEGTVAAHDPGRLNYVTYEPIGVVGQIVPWNLPLMFIAWKLAPALAAGNAVVLKPSELTPLSTLYIARLLDEVGFPPGVVNIIPGYGHDAGARLAEHAGVRKVAFTGSTAVGRSVVVASAENLKRVQLELGGKGPNLIFADADLPRAADAAVNAAFHNQGQACIAGSRLLVDAAVASEMTERIAALVEELRVGDPLDHRTEIGPLISAEHRARVAGHLDAALGRGAEVIASASLPSNSALASGYFFAPQVIRADQGDPICREEVFGPLLTITTFQSEEEAVRIANSLEYGLGAGLWTRDVDRAHRVAGVLESGMVWVNTYKYVTPGSPFGGIKQSGYGREMGLQGLREYSNQKSVWVDHTGVYSGRYGADVSPTP